MAEDRLRKAVSMCIENEHPAWIHTWHNKRILMVGDNRVCGLVPLDCHMQDLAPALEYVYFQRASILKILEATFEKLTDMCLRNMRPEIVVLVALHCDFTTFTDLNKDIPVEILVPTVPFSQEKKNDVFARVRRLKNAFPDITFIFTLPYVPYFYDHNINLTKNCPETHGLIDQKVMIEHGKQYKLFVNDFLKSWQNERLGIIEDMEEVFDSFSAHLPVEDNTLDGLQPSPTLAFRFWMSISAIAKKLYDCRDYFHNYVGTSYQGASFDRDGKLLGPVTQQEFEEELNMLQLDFFDNKRLREMFKVHNEKCKFYLENPEVHPRYEEEKGRWFQARRNSPDANNQDLEEMWVSYWRKELESVFAQKWDSLKRDYLMKINERPQMSERNLGSPSHSPLAERNVFTDNSNKRRRYKDDSHSDPSIVFSNFRHSEERESASSALSNDFDGSRNKRQDPRFNENGQFPQFDPPPIKSEPRFKDNLDLSNQSYWARSAQHSFPKVKNDDFDVLSLTTILFHISERFGGLSMALIELHAQASRAVRKGEDPIRCIDDDAEILLELVADKITTILEGNKLTLVQRGIIHEAHTRLKTFLKSLNKDANIYSQLDLEAIAKSTIGKHASEIIACIETAVKEKEFYDISRKKLMETYMKIKTLQFNMENILAGSSNNGN